MTLFLSFRERLRYIWDRQFECIYNWLDLIGIFGILLIIPLRSADKPAQWVLAAIAYAVNFLRIFKFSSACK